MAKNFNTWVGRDIGHQLMGWEGAENMYTPSRILTQADVDTFNTNLEKVQATGWFPHYSDPNWVENAPSYVVEQLLNPNFEVHQPEKGDFLENYGPLVIGALGAAGAAGLLGGGVGAGAAGAEGLLGADIAAGMAPEFGSLAAYESAMGLAPGTLSGTAAGVTGAGGGTFAEQLAALEAGLSPQAGVTGAAGGGEFSLGNLFGGNTTGLLGAGANLAGALFGANAAKRAANLQSQSADKAIDFQRQMYANTQQNLAPWMGQGVTSLGQLRDLTATPNSGLLKPFGMEDFQASPAYQFNLQEGQRAIENAARARQTYYAPATMRDLARFSQGQASNEFQNAYNNYNTNMGNIWNRLYSLSSGGQNAAANLGAFGTTVGSQVAQNMMGQGNTQAAGQVGAANALSGGLGNAYNAYLTSQILGNMQRPTYG